MRTFFLTAVFALAISSLAAQTDSLWQGEFRKLSLEDNTDRKSELEQIFSYSDSLGSKNSKFFLTQLDSIALADSIPGTRPSMKAYVEMEKHFWYTRTGKPAPALASLKNAQQSIMSSLHATPFFDNMSAYMVSIFEKAGDYAAALEVQKELQLSHEINQAKLMELDLETRDKHENEIDKQKSEIALLQKKAGIDKDMITYLMAGGALLLLLTIIFVATTIGARKKLRYASVVKVDTAASSELEILAKKMDDLKKETTQFRTTAQLTVDKLNTMDAVHRRAHIEILSLDDELTTSLTELNAQCEKSKNSIAPPLYMAIQNTVTRLNNSAQKKIDTIIELLKS